MKILVTGAKGFVGKNLCESLKNIKNGKDRTRPNLTIEEIFEYDIDGTEMQLENYCKQADFVFHLAGVNRPKTQEEFMLGNFGFSSTLLQMLKKERLCLKTVKVQQKNFLENVISNADYNFLKNLLKQDGNLAWYFVVRYLAATGARVSELIQIKIEPVQFG